MVGVGAGVNVRATGIVCGVFVAPLAVTVMTALYVPAVSPAAFMLAVSVPLPDPEAGLRVIHETLSLALQVNVPPPRLLIFTV